MEREMLETLLASLSWHKPQEEQDRAIAQLVHLPEEQLPLLLQNTTKPQWYNAVQVIAKIGYPKNKSTVPQLLRLLMDANWPGASEAKIILTDIPREELLPYLRDALLQAHLEDDEDWIGFLRSFVQ